MSFARPKADTLVDLLRLRAARQPNKLAYAFLPDGETESRRMTYAELDQQVRSIAAELQDRNLVGERALLLYPSGLDFIAGFFACLYAGVIAVPAYPPHPKHPLTRLKAIASNAEPQITLSTQEVWDKIQPAFDREPSLATLQRLTTDTIDHDAAIEAQAGLWKRPDVDDNTFAFLQYTSGSTGQPKGVMVTHGNILCNEEMIAEAYQHNEETVVVAWLPLFHDMGLIGDILQPLYLGVPSYLMPPIAFLQKPIRWLRAMSNYGGTSSGGPNFSYDLCVQKITPDQCIDLGLDHRVGHFGPPMMAK